MSQGGPKLYTNKPKKAHLKKFQEGHPNVSASTAPPSSASYKMGGGSQPTTAPPSSTPPPHPPKESFATRYKFMWPLLLAVNFTVGAYLFTRTKKKDTTVVVAGDPIPANQQRELFKWILEEKRKMEPKDEEEKKRLEEEKAILKHFIRAKSIPSV